MRPLARAPRFWIYIALAVLAILSSLLLTRNVDLRVYWLGVNGYFSGARPAYGPESGLGTPMEYRYPPVTYLLLLPLRNVPLRVAGFCWMLLAWASAVVTIELAVRIRKLQFSFLAVLAVCAYMLADVILAIRYGNVQPFVISALFACLVLSETYPVISGILLALAVTFKIWPIMFLPWFFRRNRWPAAAVSGVAFAALWIAPFAVFGPARYISLLHDWYIAVARVGTTHSEFYYFPSQSVRGLLLRYLTPVDPQVASFPHINFLSIAPATAVTIYGVLSLITYCCVVFLMLRSPRAKQWAWDGVVFVLYSLIEPYAVKSGLISLGPAVLTAGCLYTLGTQPAFVRSLNSHETRATFRANKLFLAASLISFAEALIQYRPIQRYLLSFGIDFWTGILLFAALIIWALRTPLPELLSEEAGQRLPAAHSTASA